MFVFRELNKVKQNIRGISLLSLMFFIIFSSTVLFSQSYESFKNERIGIIEKKSVVKFGPFRILPRIQFRNIGYDNNVYRQYNGEEEISDFTTTFSPVLHVHMLIGNGIILSIEDNPEYHHYFKVKRERKWSNSIIPKIKFILFNRFVLTGQYSNLMRRSRSSSELDTRMNLNTKSYLGQIFYETATRTMIGFSTSVSKIFYSDVFIEGIESSHIQSLNREERTSKAEFYYNISSKSVFFLTAGYSDYRFNGIANRLKNSYSNQFYAGLKFPLAQYLRGNLSIGYKVLNLKEGNLEGFSGLVGDSGLDFRTGRFAFRVGFKRNFQFSFFKSNIYYIENRYNTGISLYFSKLFKINYDYDYGKNLYPNPIINNIPDIDPERIKRIDLLKTHSLGFTVRVKKTTGIGISATSWEVSSNSIRRGKRKQLFVSLNITQNF